MFYFVLNMASTVRCCEILYIVRESFKVFINDRQLQGGTSVVVPQGYMLLCACVFGLQ